jgi:O-antigen ligase
MLFKENYLTGVGLKNYRVDCDFQIDPRPTHLEQFCSSHPHNLFLEILSETGIIGFSIFTTFIILIFKRISIILNFNYKQLSLFNFARGSFIILLIYVWPIKTSGSFFTTFNGSFFWFNLGLSILIIKNFKKIKDN